MLARQLLLSLHLIHNGDKKLIHTVLLVCIYVIDDFYISQIRSISISVPKSYSSLGSSFFKVTLRVTNSDEVLQNMYLFIEINYCVFLRLLKWLFIFYQLNDRSGWYLLLITKIWAKKLIRNNTFLASWLA